MRLEKRDNTLLIKIVSCKNNHILYNGYDTNQIYFIKINTYSMTLCIGYRY